MVYIDYHEKSWVQKFKYFLGRYITGSIEGNLPPCSENSEESSRKVSGLEEKI
jgi:hypothetical protein